MAYLVRITLRAERDLGYLFRKIDAEYSGAALKWYRDLKQAILSLEERPNRCPVTPETRKLRDLLFGEKPNVYRVIFQVLARQNCVEVLHVRHGARRKFKVSNRM